MADVGIGIRFVGHSTVLIETGGARILTDPFLRAGLGPLQRHGALPDVRELGGLDAILISHGHPDHFDRRSLELLGGRPPLVVPAGLGALARRWWEGDVIELVVGDVATVAGLAVEAVPARHWVTPGAPRARPLGYVLGSGRRTWFAGDTGRYPAMAAAVGRVDVALLPVWTWGPHLGPGHLGPRSAAEVLGAVGARVGVPIHWGTLYPRRLHHFWRRPLTRPGERFAAWAGSAAPRAEVRVLLPGETTTVDG